MQKYTFKFRNAKERSTLNLFLFDDKERLFISTGIIEDPTTFDRSSLSFTKANSNYKSLNGILTSLKAMANRAVADGNKYGHSLADTKMTIVEILGRNNSCIREKRPQNEVVSFFNTWACTPTTKRPSANKQGQQSARLFEDCFKSRNLKWKDVTLSVCEEWIEYMFNVRNLSANTRGGHVKNLKCIMNEAYNRGLHTNLAYKQFRKEKEETDAIYLNKEEIEKMENVKLGDKLARARDLFLIGCYTAMRFSDYSRLSIDDIRDSKIYQIQQKTKERTVIPLNPKILTILNRYGGKAPEISLQKFNDYIKLAAQEAGLKEPVTICVSGKMVTMEKWELVSSHTARRSAATNMYLSGIPAISIMKITGHRTAQNFMRYIKISKEENAEKIKDSDFFKM